MTELDRAIEAIEYGLLPIGQGEEQSTRIIALNKRMKHYKVPGFSAAFVYQEELAWAKGFGEVGCIQKSACAVCFPTPPG